MAGFPFPNGALCLRRRKQVKGFVGPTPERFPVRRGFGFAGLNAVDFSEKPYRRVGVSVKPWAS